MKKSTLILAFSIGVSGISFGQGWIGSTNGQLEAKNSNNSAAGVRAGIGVLRSNNAISDYEVLRTKGELRFQNISQANGNSFSKVLVTNQQGRVRWVEASDLGGSNSSDLDWELVNGGNDIVTGHGLNGFPTGNVGIGTITPGAKLDVNGNANIVSNFTVNNTLIHADAQNNRLGIGTNNPFNIGIYGGDPTFSPKMTVNTSVSTYGWSHTDGNVELASWITAPNSVYLPGAQIGTISNHDLHFFTRDITRLTLTNAGDLGVGTISPQEKLDVNGLIRTTGTLVISDKNYKKNIVKIESVLDKLANLNGYTYYFKTSGVENEGNSSKKSGVSTPKNEKNFSSKKQYGVIAQEVEKVFPEMVNTYKDGKAVNYTMLIPVLIEALKEQQEVIENKTSDIEELKDRLAKIEVLLLSSSSQNINVIDNSNDAIDVRLINENSVVLNQNTPNPFKENTVISWFLPEEILNSKIIFSDNKGNMIKEVNIEQRGESSMNVYADNLSTGIYFYTLIADGEKIETKKMILNK